MIRGSATTRALLVAYLVHAELEPEGGADDEVVARRRVELGRLDLRDLAMRAHKAWAWRSPYKAQPGELEHFRSLWQRAMAEIDEARTQESVERARATEVVAHGAGVTATKRMVDRLLGRSR